MTEPSQVDNFDAVVVGGGPAGLATAIALASAGVKTALIARHSEHPDNRTTALLGASLDFLRDLDVWRRCETEASALRVMRLVDDTGRLIRAPEVVFRAEDIGRDAFGFNIENRLLVAALQARASELAELEQYDVDADSIDTDEDHASVTTTDKTHVRAKIVIGADGRNSLARQSAGIRFKTRELKQSALTLNVAHSRPHQNISTEFHTSEGPCVFVPLPGQRSSVVWVMSPGRAAQIMALSDDDLALAVEQQAHSILGQLTINGGRHVFPLTIQQPVALAGNRIALVGEAAHVLPPIGAQGLNMGFRDAADIAEIVGEACMHGTDPGSKFVLDQYVRSRRADVASRTFVIDMANRSLLNDFLPVQAMRAAGLQIIDSIGPLKRLAMREGLAPSWRRPVDDSVKAVP
jgi:2-octaprenyl-6-methoxyphenol hydroxylase